MSDKPQPISRARRIRDEEWEARRPTIEKLYREPGSSRNAVIEKLKQDGFTVTEKQIKHRFKKWNVKKKISSTDMEIMLATRRRRSADGKATQFAYYGQVVDEEKFQRAKKRFKMSGSSPLAMPSYIEVFSPEPSNRSPLLGQATALAGIEHSSNNRSPLGLSHGDCYSPPQGSPLFKEVQQGFAFDPNDADFGLPSFQQSEDASWNTWFTQTAPSGDLSLHHSPDFSTSLLDNDAFEDIFGTDTLANSGGSIVDISQNSFVPPVSDMPSTLELSTALPIPVPNSVIASPLIAPLKLGEPSSGFRGHQSGENTTPNKVLFYGTNPEKIIHSVQMIKTHVRHFQDETFLYSHVSPPGLFQRKLIDEILSEVLLSEIDDVACWAYEESAKFIRQRRITRQPIYPDITLSPGHSEDHVQMPQTQSGTGLNNAKCSGLAGALTSCCYCRTFCTTGGAFQIQLRQTPKKDSEDGNDTPYYVVIYAIPEVRTRTETGIHVTFPRRAQSLPIYTTIRAFNVVPGDSEIIKYVRNNDLEGVRRLIRESKASPRDVDPRGTSLLSYAIYSGCSDIFRLLLEGGANTNQCKICSNLASLIDCIWNNFVDLKLSHGGFMNGFPTMDLIKDIDQCKSMTEIALANGCLVEESIPYYPEFPTPLFWMNNVTIQESTVRQFADALKQLLAVGYDKEFRNWKAQTPLLSAAFHSTFRSLTTLKLLLVEEADIQAIDSEGRGALHLCFDFSESLYENYYFVCRRYSEPLEGQSISEDIAVAEVFSDSNREEALSNSNSEEAFSNSNREEEAYSDGASGDEEPDVRVVGCDHDGLSSTSESARECYFCGDFNLDSYGSKEPSLFDYCEIRDIDDFNMPNVTLVDNQYPDTEPEPWMNRARLRLKLLTLLQAGCNPNTLDTKGASPSDYARNEGLWPQWEWALAESGWRYNEDTGYCEGKNAMT